MSEIGTTFFIGHDARKLDESRDNEYGYVGPVPDNKWPQHYTITPPVIEKYTERLERVFETMSRCAKQLTAFDAETIGEAYFNGNKVSLVDGLEPVHYMMIGILDNFGYGGQYPHTFVGQDYNGHVTHRNDVTPPRLGEQVHIDHLSIFCKTREGKKYIVRRVLLKPSISDIKDVANSRNDTQ